MARAPKVCSTKGCPNFQPCPVPGHSAEPWSGSNRRARLRKPSGSREQRINRTVMHVHDGICHVCGKAGADEVDHVIPLAEGGEDTFDNRRPIHSEPCHREKTQQEANRARARN